MNMTGTGGKAVRKRIAKPFHPSWYCRHSNPTDTEQSSAERKNKVKLIVRDFVDTMDVVVEKPDHFPMSGKTGIKLGWMTAFSPVVAPIATSIVIGGRCGIRGVRTSRLMIRSPGQKK